MERSAARNIKVYNPTTNTLNVRWEPASGDVQQYRVVYSPLTGTRPSQSVSNSISDIWLSSKLNLSLCVISLKTNGQALRLSYYA